MLGERSQYPTRENARSLALAESDQQEKTWHISHTYHFHLTKLWWVKASWEADADGFAYTLMRRQYVVHTDVAPTVANVLERAKKEALLFCKWVAAEADEIADVEEAT
jgi:hypothetical protein